MMWYGTDAQPIEQQSIINGATPGHALEGIMTTWGSGNIGGCLTAVADPNTGPVVGFAPNNHSPGANYVACDGHVKFLRP